MKIERVTPGKTLKDWMDLPWSIYRNDANWIPHLRQDIAKVFDPKKNKLLDEGKAERWIVYDEQSKAIGRIAGFVNPKTAYTEKQPTGGMGFFECIEDQAVADLLLDTVRDWLKEQGMEAMDGPINLGDRNMFWGLLTMNFTDPAIYGTNYNPPYYKELLKKYGFQVYFDQLFFKRSASVPAQPIFVRKYKQLMSDPDLSIRDSQGRSIEQIAEDVRIVYNAAWIDHDNHKEMDPATAFKLVNSMAQIIDRRLIIFVRHKDRPIAMYISIPELNEVFRYVNGNLNWWGKLKFLWHKKRGAIKTMTGIVFGVAKDFQGKGIEGALIVFSEQYIVHEHLYEDTVLTWIGDFNPRMIKVCGNLGAVNYRTLSTYRYLFDRSLPFERHPVIEKK